MTTEEFIEEARLVHGDRYDYSESVCTGRTKKVRIICPEHGVFIQTPYVHLVKGCGCPECARERLSESNKGDVEAVIRRAEAVHGGRYDYSLVADDYRNMHGKVRITCPKHGVFLQSMHNHIKGSGCPKCYLEGKKKHHNDDNLLRQKIDQWNQIHNHKYDYSLVEHYYNSQTKIPVICHEKDENGNEHGISWQTPYQHENGVGCPKCAQNVIRDKHILTTDIFIERARTIHGDKYIYNKVDYINNNTPVCITCQKHGEFWQTPHEHLDGCGCPICANRLSIGENEIYEYCNSIRNGNIVHNDRKTIPPFEIDIYDADKKIGIEYNGLLWHSEAYGKDERYHIGKLEACRAKGVRLIQIFEDEYVMHKDIVLGKLRHLLGASVDQKKVMGRKCTVSEIPLSDAKAFLDRYHIQGYVASTVYLGAFHDGALIAVMTFKEERKGSGGWELNRFASDYGCVCCGVGGKLFKYFIKTYNPLYVKSFADRRWTIDEESNIYVKLGFKFDGYTRPDYSYYISGRVERIHKFNFRKERLSKQYGLPMTMTEKEMADSVKAYRIWNCGLIRYVWAKKEGTVQAPSFD